MKSWLPEIFRYSQSIFKVLLVGTGIFILLYFFPEQEKFSYRYYEGGIWAYPDLYAPFDFPVIPDSTAYLRRKDSLKQHFPVFIRPAGLDTASVLRAIHRDMTAILRKKYFLSRKSKQALTTQAADSAFRQIYEQYFTGPVPDSLRSHPVWLRAGKKVRPLPQQQVLFPDRIKGLLQRYFATLPGDLQQALTAVFFRHLKPAYVYDEAYTRAYYRNAMENLRPDEKFVYKNELIVAKGERITPQKIHVLNSLRRVYNKDRKNYKWVKGGYLLILLVLTVLFLYYLYSYEPAVYRDNASLTLVFVNILAVAVLVFLVQRFRPAYIYAVPFIVLPVVIQTFFNVRVALLSLFAALLIIGPGLTAPMEYVLVQGAAGLAALLSMRNMTTRSEMFVSVFRVLFIYILIYAGYYFIVQGGWEGLPYTVFVQFFISGILAVILMHDLILLYEKLFGMASDISLLELLNTNNKLLRQLAEKAPGTFQHSVQVANLAEAIANEIGANPLLVRVGALYHDIGKMKNPRFFTENQTSGVNPHEHLGPKESARIIIKHVIDGIETARRNNIPERIIDFIRTHHGRGLVYYFYSKAKEQNPDVKEEDFRYPGPDPFSKETAILMMADSVEAASKSLKNPTAEEMDRLVDNIIDRQLNDGRLMNSDLSLKEISKAKKILKSKLKSIYHLRVSYPDLK